MNVQLSQQQNQQLQELYQDTALMTGLLLPIQQKTNSDIFFENHAFKITHILLIAGITYYFLKNYQAGEAPYSDFVTSG